MGSAAWQGVCRAGALGLWRGAWLLLLLALLLSLLLLLLLVVVVVLLVLVLDRHCKCRGPRLVGWLKIGRPDVGRLLGARATAAR